jgi:hypothetical protein
MSNTKLTTAADLRAVLLQAIVGTLEGRVSVPMANAVSGLSAQIHSSIRQEWDMRCYAAENFSYKHGEVLRLLGSEPEKVLTNSASIRRKGTANLLDRAIWLLLERSELWASLDGESHDVLAEQAAPYDLFFSCIERSLHEHGPLAPAALLDELRRQAETVAGGDAVITRIAELRASDPNVDFAREMSLVLDGLRLRAVRDELDLMVESGLVSPDSYQRFKQLNTELSRLKEKLRADRSA